MNPLMMMLGGTLLMDHDRLQSYVERLGAAGRWPTQAEMSAARLAAAAGLRKVSGRVAILPVHGVIDYRMGPMGYFFGGFSIEDGQAVLREYLADRSIGAVVMHFDSPGGYGAGLPEFSDMIFKGRETKPIYAIADPEMCSAALWLGTSATQVFGTPSGYVGSLGVFRMHVDYSKQLEQEGIAVSIIKAGQFKAEGNPYEPLTAEGRDYAQSQIDSLYNDFVKAVARNRGASTADVKANYGQGRAMFTKDAAAVGMIDKVMSFQDLLAKLSGDVGGSNARAAATSMLRMRHEHEKAKAETLKIL